MVTALLVSSTPSILLAEPSDVETLEPPESDVVWTADVTVLSGSLNAATRAGDRFFVGGAFGLGPPLYFTMRRHHGRPYELDEFLPLSSRMRACS